MPNLKAIDLAMAKVFGKDWKSTLSAYLTIFFVAGTSLIGYLAKLPNPKPWQLTLSSALTGLVAVAKLVLGHMTQDAGTTPAVVPGEGVQVVPSHEVPNNPDQESVKEK